MFGIQDSYVRVQFLMSWVVRLDEEVQLSNTGP